MVKHQMALCDVLFISAVFFGVLVVAFRWGVFMPGVSGARSGPDALQDLLGAAW